MSKTDMPLIGVPKVYRPKSSETIASKKIARYLGEVPNSVVKSSTQYTVPIKDKYVINIAKFLGYIGHPKEVIMRLIRK